MAKKRQDRPPPARNTPETAESLLALVKELGRPASYVGLPPEARTARQRALIDARRRLACLVAGR